jgi:Trypsin-like peptidase domain
VLDTDLTLNLIKATVQIDQPVGEGRRVVGTGFLVSVPNKGGPPYIVLVTAAHVFEKMQSANARIGWRIVDAQGNWVYKPSQLTIRGKSGPLWVQHPTQDVAIIPIEVPVSYAGHLIPQALLAHDKTFDNRHVSPGDEMMTLGYPHGFSANNQGFPILRTGRLASYPLTPSSAYPTFLIDMTAVAGNSGGPVFMNDKSGSKGGAFISGVLTRQVEMDNQRLELGLVTHAVFVRETIDMWQRQNLKPKISVGPVVVSGQVLRTPDKNASTRDIIKTETISEVVTPDKAIQDKTAP